MTCGHQFHPLFVNEPFIGIDFMADTVFMQCPLALRVRHYPGGPGRQGYNQEPCDSRRHRGSYRPTLSSVPGMDFHLCASGMDKALFKNLYGAFQMAVAPKQTSIGKISGRDLRGI